MARSDGAVIAGVLGAGLFGIYADLAYNAYSATNSSPQTTELFAGERTGTLWKYVRLGGVQVLAIGVFGSIVAGNLWPLIGVVVVGVIMSGMYLHAVRAGGGRVPTLAEAA